MMMTDKFIVEIVRGPSGTQSFVFRQKTIHIGSTYALNNLTLNMEGISSRHARIRRNGKAFDIHNVSDAPFVIGDGTTLESQKTLKVKPGTEIDMGAVAIRLFNRSSLDASSNEKRVSEPIQDRTGPGRPTVNRTRIKRMAGIGGIVGVSLLILIMAGNCIKKDGKTHDSRQPYTGAASQAPIALPAKGIYGYTRNNDKDHPDKAIFTFETDASNVELHYTAGGIDSEQEVSIHLNGRHIGYAPLAKGVWGNETIVRLPKEALKKGSVNYLVFDNMENPPKFDQWAVRNVRVIDLAKNLCDLDKAGKLVELGQQLYAQKNISKGNLYLANRYYRDAASFMQDCGKDEDLFRQAEENQQRTKRELDNLYRDLRFAFQKAYKMNNYDQCRGILQDMVLYFPDLTDERHKKAAELLENYTPKLHKKDGL